MTPGDQRGVAGDTLATIEDVEALDRRGGLSVARFIGENSWGSQKERYRYNSEHDRDPSDQHNSAYNTRRTAECLLRAKAPVAACLNTNSGSAGLVIVLVLQSMVLHTMSLI